LAAMARPPGPGIRHRVTDWRNRRPMQLMEAENREDSLPMAQRTGTFLNSMGFPVTKECTLPQVELRRCL
jgi:hypothetical protein